VGKLYAIGGFIVAAISGLFLAFNMGKNKQKTKSMEKVIKDVKKDKIARDKSASLSVDSQLDGLLDDIDNK